MVVVVVVVVAAVAERMLEYTLDVVKLDPDNKKLNIFNSLSLHQY